MKNYVLPEYPADIVAEARRRFDLAAEVHNPRFPTWQMPAWDKLPDINKEGWISDVIASLPRPR